jgi:pantoate--beta-alanine ligase
MLTLARIDETRRFVAEQHRGGHRVALVPTMGNLHEGHLALVRLAREHADSVVASIFVNPLQFGRGEDYGRYPRTLQHDLELLEGEGAAAVFAPGVDDMYPDGQEQQTTVEVPRLSSVLEGVFRPGHFAGVATVVAKLFGIVTPDIAVFGEKDFQQLAVIRQLVRDLDLGVEIVAGPTVREPDGLALSSRNQYLSPAQRQQAPALYRTLAAARRRLAAGDRSYAAIEEEGKAALAAAGFEPDYVAIRRASDLALPGEADADLVVLGAARLGATRLIDNLRVG